MVNCKNQSSITHEKLRGIYFIDPEDKEFTETHQECSQEIGNTNGSRHALQDKQDM